LFATLLTNVVCAENGVAIPQGGLGWIRHKTFLAPSYPRPPLFITGECAPKSLWNDMHGKGCISMH
jgi:hypothetical protein